jgi:hypothetical protein
MKLEVYGQNQDEEGKSILKLGGGLWNTSLGVCVVNSRGKPLRNNTILSIRHDGSIYIHALFGRTFGFAVTAADGVVAED